jgi:methylenetetrahydrofolate reductase (NADPH)
MSAPAPRISDVLAAKDPSTVTVSFEYFPPRTDAGVTALYKRFEKMAKAKPLFGDVTWGAGGGTSDLTLEICTQEQNTYGIVSNMHLTCTNMEGDKVDRALEGAKDVGIRNIVALRGDPPKGEEQWKAIDSGFSCALDLVKHIKQKYGDTFCLTVAGYPEGHPDAMAADGKCNPEQYKKEIEYLKLKVDAGANVIITQLFYCVDTFLAFVQACRDAGITIPILPGLMPILTYAGFERMTGFCKTYVPKEISDALEPIKGDEEKVKAYGIELATEMCKKLIAAGHTHMHFYCLNLEATTFAIMRNLGLLTGQEESA